MMCFAEVEKGAVSISEEKEEKVDYIIANDVELRRQIFGFEFDSYRSRLPGCGRNASQSSST